MEGNYRPRPDSISHIKKKIIWKNSAEDFSANDWVSFSYPIYASGDRDTT